MSTCRLLALSTIFCVLASLSLAHVAWGEEVTAIDRRHHHRPSGSAIKNAASDRNQHRARHRVESRNQ